MFTCGVICARHGLASMQENRFLLAWYVRSCSGLCIMIPIGGVHVHQAGDAEYLAPPCPSTLPTGLTLTKDLRIVAFKKKNKTFCVHKSMAGGLELT